MLRLLLVISLQELVLLNQVTVRWVAQILSAFWTAQVLELP